MVRTASCKNDVPLSRPRANSSMGKNATNMLKAMAWLTVMQSGKMRPQPSTKCRVVLITPRFTGRVVGCTFLDGLYGTRQIHATSNACGGCRRAVHFAGKSIDQGSAQIDTDGKNLRSELNTGDR